MARGLYRRAPGRRPHLQPMVLIAVASTLFTAPLLAAAVPADAPVPDRAATSRSAADLEASAVTSAMAVREQAQASRGQTRATPSLPATPAAPEPSVTPTPTPAPTPSAPPAVVSQWWATTAVNVRSGPSADTERVGSLAAVEQVGVTGETTEGWHQVVLDGQVGWVKGSYLSETEPAPEPAPAAEPQAPAVSDASCSISSGIESNLSGNARAVYRSVCAAYGGSVSSFGGYRPGDSGDHGSGRAVDIMVSGAPGREISAFLQSRAGELGISYLIYEQKIWMAGSPAGAWEWMDDRGGATANHYDHVHVSVG